MAKTSDGNTSKAQRGPQPHQQKGRQQGQNTGKEAWKSNLKHIDTEPGTGQVGQRPRKDEPFGSTPGEVRGHAGGKKGQAMSGQRGTAITPKAKGKAKSKAKRAGKK